MLTADPIARTQPQSPTDPSDRIPAPPTVVVVVVRESDRVSAPEPWAVSPGLIALVVSVSALTLTGVALIRGGRTQIVTMSPPAADRVPLYAVPVPDIPSGSVAVVPAAGSHLVGGYSAGPRPDTAEAYDIGPSYADEQAVNQQADEAQKDAVIEQILIQNLDMLTTIQQGQTVSIAGGKVLTPTGPFDDIVPADADKTSDDAITTVWRILGHHLRRGRHGERCSLRRNGPGDVQHFGRQFDRLAGRHPDRRRLAEGPCRPDPPRPGHCLRQGPDRTPADPGHRSAVREGRPEIRRRP